ncbi:hypothetical protein [Bifidobacterium polysaccharolyticum]|uniref:hypothetical protein n=1 Tax=Bifidobacterium polysaccharolyticum TaxID=2750967 RepID=UPI000620123F|nr:Uncharacterized protein JF71_06440 [Bifidobacterium asteroides]
MTEHKHNDAGNQYNSEAGTGSSQGNDEWMDFLNSHADELGSLESSKTAKEFEKKARKSEKKAALRAEDLKRDSFVGGSGPRDFQGRSWLDTDEVMDQSSNFAPPNPDLSDLGKRRMAFIIMTVLGLVCFFLTILIPRWSGLTGLLAGLLLLIGIAGLIIDRKNFRDASSGLFEDDERHYRR